MSAAHCVSARPMVASGAVHACLACNVSEESTIVAKVIQYVRRVQANVCSVLSKHRRDRGTAAS